MKRDDVRVLACPAVELFGWLNGTGALPLLPATTDCSCVWFTLCDEEPVRSEKLHKKGTQTVLILHQDGSFTPPEKITPYITRYLLQARSLRQPLWVVVTGNDLPVAAQSWEDRLLFFTPGKPPLIRLLGLALLYSAGAVYGHRLRALFWRLARVLRRAR